MPKTHQNIDRYIGLYMQEISSFYSGHTTEAKELVDLSLSSPKEWNEMDTKYTTGVLINSTLTLCLSDAPWLTNVLKQLNRDELKIIQFSLVRVLVNGQVKNQSLQETIEQLFALNDK